MTPKSGSANPRPWSWTQFAVAVGLLAVGFLVWAIGMTMLSGKGDNPDAIGFACTVAAPFIGGAGGLWLLVLLARRFLSHLLSVSLALATLILGLPLESAPLAQETRSATQAQEGGISGKWAGTCVNLYGEQSPDFLEISVHEDDTLTGKWGPPGKEMKIHTGERVTAELLHWECANETHRWGVRCSVKGKSLVLDYTCTWRENGKVKGGTGTGVLTRVAASSPEAKRRRNSRNCKARHMVDPLCKTKKEEIAAAAQHADRMEDLEAKAIKLVDLGKLSSLDVLAARCRRIEAEILLYQLEGN